MVAVAFVALALGGLIGIGASPKIIGGTTALAIAPTLWGLHRWN